jgi:hypothetical protein
MSAPAIGGAAIVLAAALVWYFRPESSTAPDVAEAPAPPADEDAPRVADSSPAEVAAAAPSNEPAASAVPEAPRSPLPGETPVTPMAQMLADRQQNVIVRDDATAGAFPPGLVEGEREFAAEPIDATWAPGAEATLLAKFAQMPGLKLIDLQVECRSTMCRFVLTQPTGPALEGSPDPWAILRQELGMKPRWMMSVVDRPGAPSSKSIAYLWREGFEQRECYKDRQPVPCSPEADDAGN